MLNKLWIDQQYVIIWLIIVFWSIVHATSQLKIARDKKKDFNWIDFVILLPASIFAGLVFVFISKMISANTDWMIVASAIWSFLGIAWLNKVANILLDVLSSKALWIKQENAKE